MALGLSATIANDFLEWIFNASATSTAPTNIWIQLHTGDPGASGTANVAGNATRKDLTAAMGTAASGAITNSASVNGVRIEVYPGAVAASTPTGMVIAGLKLPRIWRVSEVITGGTSTTGTVGCDLLR